MGHSHITTTERYLHARPRESSPTASPAPSLAPPRCRS
jgi:hypothetical protein